MLFLLAKEPLLYIFFSHIGRGQMGLSEEDQRKAQEFRLQMKRPDQSNETDSTNGMQTEAVANCCQGIATSSCCQNGDFNGKSDNHNVNLEEQEHQLVLPLQKNKEGKPSTSIRKMSALPTWFESWEREDTYAVLAVVTAIASVAVVYSCYRQLR